MRQTTLTFGTLEKGNPRPPPDIPSDPVKEEDFEHIFDSPEAFAKCIEPSWRIVLKSQFTAPYLQSLLTNLRNEKRKIFPQKKNVFNALKLCPFREVKVVLIGQDPYHGAGQAHGLSFSVPKGVPIPPSLRNIYAELEAEYPTSFKAPTHGNLESWAKQGVLMLNATLTVAEGEANSHAKWGWMKFTQAIISAVNKNLDGVVFIAWGNFAKDLCKGIDRKKHFLLQSGHPSPLSVKFFSGCGHFKKVNELLQSKGKMPIDWTSVCRV